MTGWSIRPAHELRQLGAGVDAQLGERIVDVGFHRVRERFSCVATDWLVAPCAIRLTTVSSESVRLSQPVFRPRPADNAPFHAQSAQLAAHPARIGEGFVAHVGVECGIELIERLVRVIGAGELAAGVLGSCGVQKRPRRQVKHVRGSDQCLGVTFEYPGAHTRPPR